MSVDPFERIVHASIDTADLRGQIVRYDRAGKWYVEYPGARRKLTVDDAAALAWAWWKLGGTPHFDRYGGSTFNRKLRSLLATPSEGGAS